jgi:aspartyl-tRNA(Asn)/glutamyl-tRNA(Gln) amidotransferase subunit A
MTDAADNDDVASFIRATSRYRAYSHRERQDLWRDRLALNAVELERLSSFSGLEEAPLQTLDGAVKAVPMPATAPCLESARAVREDRKQLIVSALERATATADHNVFTTLGNAPDLDVEDGPLSGIPVVVKDLIAVRGFPMTGGTRSLPPGPQNSDAQAVGRLRAAGATPIGMANLHELAFGITSDNPHFGRVRNPRESGRISGGSSGGSAAAVALGIVPISIGTDTAGSIRIPAACCGVTGIKPSYDLVPRDGAMALAWSLDHIGPLAGNVADLAVALSIMSGGGPANTSAAPKRATPRLVRPKNFFFDVLEPSLRARIEEALARLVRAGVEIVERDVPEVELAAAAQFATISAEATQANWHRFNAAPEGLGEDVRVRLEAGQFILAADYVSAQRFRRRLRDSMMAALMGCDAFITPTIAVGAPAAGVQHVEIEGNTIPIHAAMTRCTAPFNVTGMPALTLPCGTDRDGLPVALQLAGRLGEDAELLALAQIVETELAGIA